MTDETTTETETADRSTDPTRFAPASRDSGDDRRLGEIVGSAAALLLLIIGLPVLLLVLAGAPPIPTSLPSARDFAQQLSVEDILTVLVGVLWLSWLWFLACVVVEVLAARRGGLARSVPLAGPLQRLARVLVGALLLTGIMAGQAQAVTEAPASHTTTSVSSIVTAELPPLVVTADVTDEAAADDVNDLVGEKVYTVAAPKDGYHDNLWDIAERHLGEGRRYHEIYELNKDRLQSDGGKLQLARLIQPGWELVMPDDAVGIERVAPAAPAPVEAPPASPSEAPATDISSDLGDVATDAGDNQQGGWMAGIGLLAAGVLASLVLQRRRASGRRPGDDALELEAGLKVAASTERADRLDHVLRDLTGQCRRAGVNPPPAYAAVVDDESVELLLAPARPEAIEGWEVLEAGRRWRSTAAVDGPRSNDAVPYPALVALGVDPDGRDVLIDLESAGGIVAVTGDPGVAEQVAAAVAVQAATAPWADVVQVTASDLPDGIAEVGDARLRVAADLADELDAFERQIDGWRDGVLTGRMGRRGNTASHVVVSGKVPSADVSERLGALMGSGRQAFSVLVAGEHPGARWRLQVDANGTLTLPLLGLTVEANRVTGAQVAAVAELFAAARQPDEVDSGDRVAIPAPLRSHDDSAWTTASRRVAVLGKVAVQGGGALADERVELSTELVTYLALHPEGVHPTVLAGAVWPRGVTADVRDAGIERAREWLGTDTDGSHVLREDAEGRLSLSDSVVCDWDCARTLLLRSRRAGAPRDEIDLLRRGLKMARGEAFTDVPQGRYGWVAREDVPRIVTRTMVDAAARLAELLAGQDDPAGASTAAEAGLRVSPAHQGLWRSLLRSRHAETGAAGVRRTLDEMGVALQSVPLEAETEALVTELMPDTGTLATSG